MMGKAIYVTAVGFPVALIGLLMLEQRLPVGPVVLVLGFVPIVTGQDVGVSAGRGPGAQPGAGRRNPAGRPLNRHWGSFSLTTRWRLFTELYM